MAIPLQTYGFLSQSVNVFISTVTDIDTDNLTIAEHATFSITTCTDATLADRILQH